MKSNRAHSILFGVLGTCCLVLSVWHVLWTFYAADEALHMGSPIRRITRQEVDALRGQPAYIVAVESYGSGMALIRALEDSFRFLYFSSAVIAVVGTSLLVVAWRIRPAQAPDDAASS